MAKPDRSSIDLERPRVAVRQIRGLRWNSVGEAELVRGHQAVRHNPNTVPACESLDGGIQVNRRSPLQHGAHPGHVVQPTPGPPQLTRLDEARQCLVDSIPTTEIEEVLRRAHPLSSTMGGHPFHDFVGYAGHFVAPSRGEVLVRILAGVSYSLKVVSKWHRSADMGPTLGFGYTCGAAKAVSPVTTLTAPTAETAGVCQRVHHSGSDVSLRVPARPSPQSFGHALPRRRSSLDAPHQEPV